MAQPLTDRRADARFGQPVIAGTQAILRPNYAVSLVDLNTGDALIEDPRPLQPEAKVHLQLLTNTRRLNISTHVLHCSVASLDSRNDVQYHNALRFDHRCDALWEPATHDEYFIPKIASPDDEKKKKEIPENNPQTSGIVGDHSETEPE